MFVAKIYIYKNNFELIFNSINKCVLKTATRKTVVFVGYWFYINADLCCGTTAFAAPS